MQRKAIKLSEKTLVISLPASWVARNHVSKGDPLDLLVKDHEVLITVPNKAPRQVLHLEVRGMSNRLVKRHLAAAYRRGFESLKVTCDAGKEDFIERILAGFLGIIITAQKEGWVTAKQMIADDPNDFFMVCKRAFFLLDDAVQDMQAILNLQKQGTEKDIIAAKEHVLKHINFALFLLQEHGTRSIREGNIYFSLLSTLDTVCDLFFRAGVYLVQERHDEGAMAFFGRLTAFLYKIAASFTSGKKIHDIYLLRETLYPEHPEKTPNLMLLSVIGKLLIDLVDYRIMLDLAKDDG